MLNMSWGISRRELVMLEKHIGLMSKKVFPWANDLNWWEGGWYEALVVGMKWRRPGWPPKMPHLWPLVIAPPVISLTRDEEGKRHGYSSTYSPHRGKICLLFDFGSCITPQNECYPISWIIPGFSVDLTSAQGGRQSIGKLHTHLSKT